MLGPVSSVPALDSSIPFEGLAAQAMPILTTLNASVVAFQITDCAEPPSATFPVETGPVAFGPLPCGSHRLIAAVLLKMVLHVSSPLLPASSSCILQRTRELFEQQDSERLHRPLDPLFHSCALPRLVSPHFTLLLLRRCLPSLGHVAACKCPMSRVASWVGVNRRGFDCSVHCDVNWARGLQEDQPQNPPCQPWPRRE